jgi:hypothetical protein
VFTRYESAKGFSADALGILDARKVQNNLFYRNIGDGKFMATVKDGGGIFC